MLKNISYVGAANEWKEKLKEKAQDKYENLTQQTSPVSKYKKVFVPFVTLSLNISIRLMWETLINYFIFLKPTCKM